MEARLKEVVRHVVSFLATGAEDSYDLFAGSPVTPDDLAKRLHEYGRTLVVPPEHAYDDVEAIRIEEEGPGVSWAVAVPLWTEEEGEADLSIELTVTFADGKVDVSLDDCRVL